MYVLMNIFLCLIQSIRSSLFACQGMRPLWLIFPHLIFSFCAHSSFFTVCSLFLPFDKVSFLDASIGYSVILNQIVLLHWPITKISFCMYFVLFCFVLFCFVFVFVFVFVFFDHIKLPSIVEHAYDHMGKNIDNDIMRVNLYNDNYLLARGIRCDASFCSETTTAVY